MNNLTFSKRIFGKIVAGFILLFALFLFSSLSAHAEEIETEEETTEIQPMSSIGGYIDGWRIASTSYTGETYGTWRDCSATLDPGLLGCSRTVTVSNSFSGSLAVTRGRVEAALGFEISVVYQTTASYSNYVPARTKIQFREVYDNYSVKQNLVRSYLITGKTYILDTKYVYPKKFSHFEFRVIRY